MLIFDREKHEFFIDDVRVPSVTHVLPAKQFFVSPEHLERLRQEGKDSHNLIQMYFDVHDPGENPMLIALDRWFDEHPETGHVIQSERPLWSRKHMYAGVPDLICEKAIIDFKRSKPAYLYTPVQFAGYHRLAIENKIIKRTNQWLVLWYDGRKFKSVDVFDKDADVTFLACLSKYKAEQAIKDFISRKKKEVT